MGFNLVNLTEKTHRFMNESVIMNWSNINKAILILVLGALDHILWFFWCMYSYMNTSLRHWINSDYYFEHLKFLVFNISILFLLIIPCVFLSHIKLVQKTLPYIAVIYFAFTFMHGGYAIGILSPTTIAGYISLITVGFVLFERKIIYIVFVPVTIVLLGLIYLSSINAIQYAPFFSTELNQSILHKNIYWVCSMLYLYIPIFFASLVLFEILLIQWKNREKTINEISLKDPLTGIFNRRYISKKLNDNQLQGSSYAVILMDLDYFKNINDSFGHDVGDEVLKSVAKILNTQISDNDIVGRFGGEEFILVLFEKNLDQALEIAEHCRLEIQSKPIYIDRNYKLDISASFGVALSTPDLSKDLVIRLADQALYLAKANGRNQVRHYLELSKVS